MDIESICSENLNKELAYLLGVYLTDGSITHTTSSFKGSKKLYDSQNFTIKAIDKEFVEKTLECLKKIKPSCKAKIFEQEPRTRYWSDGRISKCQKQYCIGVGITGDAIFFEEQTGNKHHIPHIIWDAPLSIKRWFIAGVMDGDGWISKTERKDYPKHWKKGIPNYQYRIGIGKAKYGWIYEFKILLQKMGVETLKTEIDKRNGRMPMVKVGIKVKSFVEHGLFFTIKRKQDRLKVYIQERPETRH